MSPISESEVVHRRRKCLVPCRGLSITLTKLYEAGAIEVLGVWIDISILVNDSTWHRD
jgi:hypothetical protein